LIFSSTSVEGVVVIAPERRTDERGYFARTYCVDEMGRHGIDPRIAQRSLSYNHRRGTLRGMHYQARPHEENKFITCIQGTVYDVVIDLRRESPSYLKWAAITLTSSGLETLFIPKGCAHGFLTLADESVVQYDISEPHHPESARGLRYDDPAIGVSWPMAPVVINARDLQFPAYSIA
jgi:dTDP-4-dehydrorhamnose 3,5-epimerase